MMSTQFEKQKPEFYLNSAILLLIFCIAILTPVLAGMGALIAHLNKRMSFNWFVCFSIFSISVVASQKLPESDWGFYIDRFKWAEPLGLFEFLQIEGKSYIFYTFTWIISQITVDEIAFGFIVTILSYLSLWFFASMFVKRLNLSLQSKQNIVAIYLGFPLFFSLCLHIVRQMLAMPIAISALLFTNVIFVVLAIILSVLIHAVSIVIIPFNVAKSITSIPKFAISIVATIISAVVLLDYLTLRFSTMVFEVGGEESSLGLLLSLFVTIASVALLFDAKLPISFRFFVCIFCALTTILGLLEINFFFIRFLFIVYILHIILIYSLRKIVPNWIGYVALSLVPFTGPAMDPWTYGSLFPTFLS